MELFSALNVSLNTMPPDGAVVLAQHEHACRSFLVTDATITTPSCDILCTNQRSVSLSHGFADCVPIIFYDPIHHTVAFTHAGWKGLTMGSVRISMLELAQHFKSKEKDLLVWIGPCVHAASYHMTETPSQLALPQWHDSITQDESGYQIDLPGFVVDQCTLYGIAYENIIVDPRDTFADPQLRSYTGCKMGHKEKCGVFYITCALR